MGKQLHLYLEEPYAKQLAQAAAREFRRPHEHAKWILLKALAEVQADVQAQPEPKQPPQQAVAA